VEIQRRVSEGETFASAAAAVVIGYTEIRRAARVHPAKPRGPGGKRARPL